LQAKALMFFLVSLRVAFQRTSFSVSPKASLLKTAKGNKNRTELAPCTFFYRKLLASHLSARESKVAGFGVKLAGTSSEQEEAGQESARK